MEPSRLSGRLEKDRIKLHGSTRFNTDKRAPAGCLYLRKTVIFMVMKNEGYKILSMQTVIFRRIFTWTDKMRRCLCCNNGKSG